MSTTSNWAVCPRCFQQARPAHDQAVVRLMASYGTMPVEEFMVARAAIGRPAERTFREDYEIYGAEKGEVVVSYSGRCEVCSLSLDFVEKRALDA